MSGSPLSPSVSPNVEFLEHYVDAVENLPLDIQRHVSQLREFDMLYKTNLDQIGQLMTLYKNAESGKKGLLIKLQKCLIKSQQYGDEKLSIIAQIAEIVESRASQLARDSALVDMECKEEVPAKSNSHTSSNNNSKSKVEKTQKQTTSNDKNSKSLYDKPKRTIRRVRTQDKLDEKLDKNKSLKDFDENDDEDMVLDDDPELKANDTKPKKETNKKATNKEKPKDKGKDEKEDKKEEIKKTDYKNNKGKITKKNNSKQTSKIKKKKKKEKELSVEDIPVDPDEPTYCICSSISYGEMIGCDNDECQIEWFHFGCVNLTHKPKGKWYCPQCTIERKNKK